jgi:hypothetical protein
MSAAGRLDDSADATEIVEIGELADEIGVGAEGDVGTD